MAFSAEELRVLRYALAEALRPGRAGAPAPARVSRPAQYPQACLRLAEAVEEAAREAARLRAFQLAELRRYREALPGGGAGYLERLTAALAGGYLPAADDLAALRMLCGLPCGAPERVRRTALMHRCETLAENDDRLCLEVQMPAPRRLSSLPALADEPEPAPEPRPGPRPAPRPAPGPTPAPAPAPAPKEKPGPAPEPGSAPARDPRKPQEPGRRTPTPAEIWPPHRRDHKPDEARSA